MTALCPAGVGTGQKSKRERSNGYTPAGIKWRFVSDDCAASISASLSASIRPRFSTKFSAVSDIRITTMGTWKSDSRVSAVFEIIDLEWPDAVASQIGR